MTITAKVILDSISEAGVRLTTFQLRYPRFIHSEFMTHRVFSRNASSSRAIPVAKLISEVNNDPAMPVFWGKNEPGMQAQVEMNEEEKAEAIACWLWARSEAVSQAEKMVKNGAHKQIVNRLLEPFSHISVVCTATDYANFFALRRHPDAQPELKALADAMWKAMSHSLPAIIHPGKWHLPYLTEWHEREDINDALRLSVARIARVSYNNHDGTAPDKRKDFALFDRLLASKHMSPFEHQATPKDAFPPHFPTPFHYPLPNSELEQTSNFRGWVQLRKLLRGESVKG